VTFILFAKKFLKEYFNTLFVKKRLDRLDDYLDKDYFDSDIGPGVKDHVKNSKEYLPALLEKYPGIRVLVKHAVRFSDVICAHLHWTILKDSKRIVWKKGAAVFVLRGGKILKRSTFIYYESGD